MLPLKSSSAFGDSGEEERNEELLDDHEGNNDWTAKKLKNKTYSPFMLHAFYINWMFECTHFCDHVQS